MTVLLKNKKKIFNKCHLNDHYSFTLKPEVDTNLENNVVRKWADQVVLRLVKHTDMKQNTYNDFDCAADDF